MKKILKIFSIIVIIVTTITISNVFAVTADVQLNGQIIDFTDSEGNKVDAQIINDRTMVPLRKIFEILGCEIEWDGETRTATAKKGNKEIILQIDNPIAIKKENGMEEKISLDAAPVIVENRTLVPLRFIAESLEKQVGWDSSSYTAIIIDYDYFSYLIKQKNPNLYQILTNNISPISFKVEKKYIDNNDTTLNTNAILSGSIIKNADISEVTLNFSGSEELMREIANEGWNNVAYEAKYTENKIAIQTTNETFRKMLNLNENDFTEFDVGAMNLVGTLEDTLSGAIASLFDMKNVNISTFSNMKTEFETFLNLFIVNGNRNLNSKMTLLDYTKFDNIIYENELMKTLTFINQTIFRYDVSQNELLYDWPNIKYEMNCENNTLLLKINLENEYNERVEYIVECTLT